jgi:hypothetical protein
LIIRQSTRHFLWLCYCHPNRELCGVRALKITPHPQVTFPTWAEVHCYTNLEDGSAEAISLLNGRLRHAISQLALAWDMLVPGHVHGLIGRN